MTRVPFFTVQSITSGSVLVLEVDHQATSTGWVLLDELPPPEPVRVRRPVTPPPPFVGPPAKTLKARHGFAQMARLPCYRATRKR